MSRGPAALPVASPTAVRRARPRHYLMCPPTHFDVRYAINPWMDPSVPVDRALALQQWTGLVEVYRALGHRVDLLEPSPGLPDQVYAANGATVIDGRVLVAAYATPQRRAEAELHRAWHRTHGRTYRQRALVDPIAVNEAEGDFAVLSATVLAGHGFRTAPAAHAELARVTGREVIGLELVDPRFYHLDVALTVLDDRRDHLAYVPEAFTPAARALLASRFPDAIRVSVADALALGLNAVSDGRHVVLTPGAEAFAADLTAAGYAPVIVDLSELIKGGGAAKCCTQELRPARTSTRTRSRS